MPSLFDTFAILKPDLKIDQLAVTATLYQELDQRYEQFRSHVLISAHSFSEDWGVWEFHPEGDELVVLISGGAELILKTENGENQISLKQPGDFLLVPQGTWHTAKVAESASMLFITAGEGTRNEAEPDL